MIYSRVLWFCVCAVAFAFDGNTQFRYMDFEQAKTLSERTILVQLFDGDNDEAREANKFLKEYFVTHLKIGKEVRTVSASEIEALLKSNEDKYATITHDNDEHDIVGRRKVNNKDRFDLVKSRNENFSMATLSHYDIELYLASDKSSREEFVTEVDFVHYYLRPEDYVFAAKQFTRLYNSSLDKIEKKNYYQVKTALAKLQTKTLLVDSAKVRFKLSKAKGYDNDYKFTDYNEIKAAIIDCKKSFVYPLMMWSWQLNAYLWVIVDAETGEIYSTVTNGGVNYTEFGKNEPPGKISKTHFKYFDSKLANTVNNRY